MFKKLLLILAVTLCLSYIFGLTAGDIAILGVNTDATKSLAFVALADIPANTTITFTDNAWNASTQVWRTGEGSFTWTHTALVAKGTVVNISLGTTFTVDLGTVTTNASFNLSASGDQILAYEGTTAPTTNADATWLFGFSIENWVWANNPNTSDIPTVLIGASIGLTGSTTEFDNGYFANGNTAQTAVAVSGTKAELLVLFCDNTKYYTNDTGPLTFPAYTITVSGGTPTPTITATGTLNPFSTNVGTPSASQSYTLSGSNLTANIVVTAPTGYAISTDNSTFTSSVSVVNTFNGLIYIRLTGASVGSFNGNITHTSTGAAQVDKAVTGTVNSLTPTISVTGTLNPFNTLIGTPSASQSYTLTGTNLTANISVTPPAGFELSTDNTTFTASLSLASNYNALVYVRLTGATAGTFSGNITHTSTGASQQNVAASGTVTDPNIPTTFLEENFNYTVESALTDNGWNITGSTATPIVSVSEGNLVYPGYYAYTGNMISLATSGQDVNRTFTPQSTGSVYASFLINVTSAQTNGDYFLNLGGASMGTSYYGRVFLKRDGTTDNAFIGLVFSSGTGGVIQYTTSSYPYGSTILLVLKYQVVDGTLNDVVYLYVNPTPGAAEPAATLTSAGGFTGALADLASIGTIGLRQGSSSAAAAVKVDGIRITNNWAKLWEGTPPATPVIHVSTTELDPLVALLNSPSDEVRSYTLYGVDLMGGVTVTAPYGFQVSTSETTGWASSISVASSFNGLIYVRMFPDALGTYENNIVHTSAFATPVNVHVSGECISPSVVWNIPASLTAFSGQAGTPTAAQSYNLSASNAVADLVLTTTAPFQLSTNGTSGWALTQTFPYNYNGLVYVRMNPTSAGSFNATINHNSTDATEGIVNISGSATAQPGMATDLFFSEYLEGSSNNKALEIFNGTGGAVDLGNYKVILYSNGATAPGNTLTFTPGTMLAHNDVYVIANAGANATILGLADVTSTVTYYNGDDAVALVKIVGAEEQYVDIFGMIGQDPGTAWTADGGYSTLDKTLVRKPNINQGVSVNPTGYAAGDVTAFETLASEWDVYAVDTISYLGSHTFNPGGNPMVATPTFNPPAGNYFSPINVTIATTTPGATIRYTTNGDVPNASSTLYTGPVAISATTTLKAIAFATGYDPSSVAIASYSYPTDVANIAALRAMPTGATVYRLTGEAVLTFQQANRNQKYIQDATAAIVIDDPSGVITTTYSLYDGITGLVGTLGAYSNLIQFTPVADPGAATSSGNVVVPVVRTSATVSTDDQAKLLKLMNVTLDATNVNFGTVAENITATDAAGTITLRTFPSTDYSGTAIPTAPVDIVCLGGQYGTGMQISPRFLADITPAAGTLEAPIINISQVGGTVSLSWAAVAGATSYRIEAADDPYGTFTELSTTTNLFYSGAADAKKFYRVIALN